MSPQSEPTAIPSYSKEAYEKVLKMVPRSETIGALPYGKFVKHLERCESEIVSRGGVPFRVEIEPSAAEDWAKINGRKFGHASIAEYAAWTMFNSLRKKAGN